MLKVWEEEAPPAGPFIGEPKGGQAAKGAGRPASKFWILTLLQFQNLMGKIKRRCGKKKKWKSEKVMAGRLANLPQSLPTFVPHSHMSPRCLSHRLKAKKWKATYHFLFSNVVFNSFGILGFWKMQKLKNQICCWKGEKSNMLLANGVRKAEKLNMR
jgi:hypothetical protein